MTDTTESLRAVTPENLRKLARLIEMGQPLQARAASEAIVLCAAAWDAALATLEATSADHMATIRDNVDLLARLEAAERERDADPGWERYRRKDGSPVYVRLTWPTGAKEVTTLEGLAFTLPDYLDGFEVGEEFAFEIVEMTLEQYEALPEFLGP